MIYIDITDKTPEESWINKSENAKVQLMTFNDSTKRANFIKNSAIWGELKDWLLELSHRKCWYSEVKNLGIDWHVDHFRPKNRAKNKDGSIRKQNGYWWLAFDWKNYRIATTWCNCIRKENDRSYGKGDFFPIKEGSTDIECYGDCNLEQYYLIDPTNEQDVQLISFDESGSVIATTLDPWENKRVEVSKDLYHLESKDLKDARKNKWNECMLCIERVNKYASYENLAEEIVEDAINDIKKLIDPSESLSAVAKACLLSSGHEWAKEIINDI